MMPKKKRRSSLCNPVMFSVVMKDEDLFRELLARILPDRKIRKLKLCEREEEESLDIAAAHLQTEKNIILNPYAKPVRFDVLFEEDEAWYNVEMQAVDTKVLPQRSRYYHAAATVDSLARGQGYKDLHPGYVIFLCLFDLFQQDRPLYSFQMYDEKNRLHLNDGQFTMFLNAACRKDDVPDGLKNLFLYLEENTVNRSDPWICDLHNAVKSMEQKREVLSKMTLYDEWYLATKDLEQMKQDAEEAKAALEKFKAEMQQTETALRESHAELLKSKAELQESNAELLKSKAELQESNAELLKTETELQESNTELLKTETERQKIESQYQRFQLLSERLLCLDRAEDLKKALKDPAYQNQLFSEFDI